MLDAEGEVFNARIKFVGAQHDARVAVYRLLLATGQLVPANLSIASNYFFNILREAGCSGALHRAR